MSAGTVVVSGTADPTGIELLRYSPTFPAEALSFVTVPGYCPAGRLAGGIAGRSELTKARKTGIWLAPEAGPAKNVAALLTPNELPSRKPHPGNVPIIFRTALLAPGAMPCHAAPPRTSMEPTVDERLSSSPEIDPLADPVLAQSERKNCSQTGVGVPFGVVIGLCGTPGKP